MTYYHLKKPEEVKRSLPNKAYRNLTLDFNNTGHH
jgi:hypothetical protein